MHRERTSDMRGLRPKTGRAGSPCWLLGGMGEKTRSLHVVRRPFTPGGTEWLTDIESPV